MAGSMAHLVRIDVLDETLQGWHPARCQVAVLKEDPLAPLYGAAHHGFCPRALEDGNIERGQLLTLPSLLLLPCLTLTWPWPREMAESFLENFISSANL